MDMDNIMLDYGKQGADSPDAPHKRKQLGTSELLSPLPSGTFGSELSPTVKNGRLCYGNERKALDDLGRYYNNRELSDLQILVGKRIFYVHKLVLVRASNVFDKMLSLTWRDQNQIELELHEEDICVPYFSHFLRYLYTCHIVLNLENTMAILMLADKYDIQDLKSICIDHSCSNIIKEIPVKQAFHVWFKYGAKCHCRKLVDSCVLLFSRLMMNIITEPEWSQDWIELDENELLAFLSSSDLQITDEGTLFSAVQTWLNHSPERVKYAMSLYSKIRFSHMEVEDLLQLEQSEELHPFLFDAYKWKAMSLLQKTHWPEFVQPNHTLRNYLIERWDQRLTFPNFMENSYDYEATASFRTCSSSLSKDPWDWELKVRPASNCSASANTIFHCRLYAVNMLLNERRVVDCVLCVIALNKRICFSFVSKVFTHTKFCLNFEIEEKLMFLNNFISDGSLVLEVQIQPMC